MRSFLFIGDPQEKVDEWLDGEHKVLVIAPAADHDSTNRAIVTLQGAGLEHEIVKTVILDEEYVFGEGKLDEFLQTSTKQTHYPYIYINKEFVGDHRTIAYMDYQGTLMNTVGLVFMVPQSSSGDPGSSRHPSSNQVEKPGEEDDEDGEEGGEKVEEPEGDDAVEEEERASSGNIFEEDPVAVQTSIKGSDNGSKGSDKGSKGSDKGSKGSYKWFKRSDKGSKGSDKDSQDSRGSIQASDKGSKVSGSPVHSCSQKSGSFQGSYHTGCTPYKSIVPTPDTVDEPGCFGCSSDSPSPDPDIPAVQLCAACNKAVETVEKGAQTVEQNEEKETPGYIS